MKKGKRERKRKRKKRNERTSRVPLDRWNYSSFLQSGNFRLCCERRAKRCEEALFLSLSFLPFSHTLLSRTTVILALIFSPVLFCDVVESIYRGFSCPSAPARPSVLFSSSAIRAQVRGPYRPRLPNCGKPPDRQRERRFDKDRTERSGENNWSAFV